jgi:glutaminyl-tRNA synthetase
MQRVGVTKKASIVDIELLEYCLRQDLNKRAPRSMAVLDPLKLVITNYPDDQVEEFDAVNNPEDQNAGTRKVPFSKVLYIEQEDFMESPSKDFYRLAPGREVRLRYACLVKCVHALKDASGKIVELRCTYDPDSRGGEAPDRRKVKATLHWVSAQHARDAEVRLYESLFTKANPMEVAEGESFLKSFNPNSLVILQNCKIEPGLAAAKVGEHFQFERKGYFCMDPDSAAGKPVFNRIVTLRDTWAKMQQEKNLGK